MGEPAKKRQFVDVPQSLGELDDMRDNMWIHTEKGDYVVTYAAFVVRNYISRIADQKNTSIEDAIKNAEPYVDDLPEEIQQIARNEVEKLFLS